MHDLRPRIKERTKQDSDGRRVSTFEIYDVLLVDDEVREHRMSDVSFDSVESAQAFIDNRGK
jgi:hypothetical protein